MPSSNWTGSNFGSTTYNVISKKSFNIVEVTTKRLSYVPVVENDRREQLQSIFKLS